MPKTTIILTHHQDSVRPYLELALLGLKRQDTLDFQVILVSDAESAPPVLPVAWISHWDKSLDTSAKKVKWALANSESDFVIQHSDDVVMAHQSVREMTTACESTPSIMNPFSNSDCRSVYLANIFLNRGKGESKHLIHDMSYDDISGWEEELISFPLGRRVLFPVQTLSFFCTIMPRSVWSLVGELDPELEYRHNDQDFCFRAARHGIPSLINLAPFVFHFGSKTIGHMAHDETKKRATEHFMKKWGTP